MPRIGKWYGLMSLTIPANRTQLNGTMNWDRLETMNSSITLIKKKMPMFAF
jgi:hypothetical protein